MKIKVLIADDSVVYRSQIKAALQELPWVEIQGVAPHGRVALSKMEADPPDLLVLDLEMPEMDGLTTLQEMRSRGLRCKVLVFSSASKRGAAITLDALRLGATDFIAKPGAGSIGANPADLIKELLLPKVKALFPAAAGANAPPVARQESGSFPRLIWDLMRPRIILIGSSTGGPTAIEGIFSTLASPLNCPVVIAQHMPPLFTTTFAERIARTSGIPACEAADGMHLEKNHIYVAPGDFHLRLTGDAENTVLCLDQGPAVHSVRPAVDPLFQSAAGIFRDKCLAFVLTGMGEDGRDGSVAVKRAGGAVVIQEASTCVVFGMPGAVQAAGAFDRVASPKEIAKIMREKAGISHLECAAGGG